MKWKLFSVFIVLSLILVACNTTDEGMRGNDTDGNNVQPTRHKDDVNNNRNNVRNTGDSDRQLNDRRNGDMDNNRDNRNNRRNNDENYDISEEAANKITDEITEIDHAYVLTTKNNAYVAAAFDADDDDNDDGGKADRNDRTDRNDKANRDKDDNANLDKNRNNGANDRNMRNNDQMDDDRLTDDVKENISDIVKSVDDDIDNVYVSTNPDFLDLTTNYVNDMDNGHPVRGFFDQMGDMVERLFPQNK